MVLENGKPLAEAKGEVGFSAGYFNWYAEEARRAYGETVPSPFANKRLWVQASPVGVVGAITPWNFPANMITRKIAPAMAAGCTVVHKPAEWSPLTATLLAEIAHEAGLPAGVLNLVNGVGEVAGRVLTEHPGIHAIAFVGGSETGRALYCRVDPGRDRRCAGATRSERTTGMGTGRSGEFA